MPRFNLVLATLLILAGTESALAADRQVEMPRQLGLVLVEAHCAVALQKKSTGLGEPQDLLADNRTLHQCQYALEVSRSFSLSLTQKWPSYSEWSSATPDFNPALPRATFLTALEARQLRLAALTSAAKKGSSK